MDTSTFNPSQKDRLLNLVSGELANLEDQDSKILEDIQMIKEKIGLNEKEDKIELFKKKLKALADKRKKSRISSEGGAEQTENNLDNDSTQISSSLNKYIDPSDLAKFLIAYNQHPVLRYTCHEIDDSDVIDDINQKCGSEKYDFIEHQKLIAKSFDDLSRDYKINKKIYSLIRGYLHGPCWSSEKISMNWLNDELIEWSKKNPGTVPNPGENLINRTQTRGFKFKEAIVLKHTGERINSFSKLTLHFKHLFHLKLDNSLKSLLEREIDNNEWQGKIKFDIEKEKFWENLELFTDVDKLLQACRAIFRIIIDAAQKQNSETPIVKLAFYVLSENTVLIIHHINSVYGKTINDSRIGDSQTLLINNQINGLCDLFLGADFGHGDYGMVNLWDGKKRNVIKMDYFTGVQYLLRFKT